MTPMHFEIITGLQVAIDSHTFVNVNYQHGITDYSKEVPGIDASYGREFQLGVNFYF